MGGAIDQPQISYISETADSASYEISPDLVLSEDDYTITINVPYAHILAEDAGSITIGDWALPAASGYNSILPSNSAPLEIAVEQLAAEVFGISVRIDALWDPDRAPSASLGYLAWALSVDDWNSDWTDDRKREAIRSSVAIHRRKGTPWAIKRALEAVGLGTAELIEDYGAKLHDGSLTYNGGQTYSPEDHWAEYRVILDRAITIEQASMVRAVLASVAPARCHLKALDYQRALNIYDAAINYDGTYTHGVA